jgi:hypothetical protein
MASGAGYYDANGIYRYGETDQVGLFSDMLNIGMESVSDSIANLSGILQISSVNLNTLAQITSTSYVDVSGLSVSITPKRATSKMLLLCKLGSVGHTDAGNGAFLRLFKSGSGISDSTTFVYNNNGNAGIPASIMYLDSPNTTSAITYSLRALSSSGTVRINGIGQNTGLFSASSLIVVEIAG